MTTTDLVASAAITFSLVAVFATLIAVSVVFQKGEHLNQDLLEGMDEFKDVSDDSWGRLMSVKMGRTFAQRKPRDSYYGCNCYDYNSCPSGPSGVPGYPGSDG